MYCTSIENIVNTVLKNEDIILCRETAASYLGMANGWGMPVTFYTTNKNIINSSYIQGIVVEELDKNDTTIIKNIVCTNEERTICELLENGDDYQYIVESMADYYYSHGESFDKITEKMNSNYTRNKGFAGTGVNKSEAKNWISDKAKELSNKRKTNISRIYRLDNREIMKGVIDTTLSESLKLKSGTKPHVSGKVNEGITYRSKENSKYIDRVSINMKGDKNRRGSMKSLKEYMKDAIEYYTEE